MLSFGIRVEGLSGLTRSCASYKIAVPRTSQPLWRFASTYARPRHITRAVEEVVTEKAGNTKATTDSPSNEPQKEPRTPQLGGGLKPPSALEGPLIFNPIRPLYQLAAVAFVIIGTAAMFVAGISAPRFQGRPFLSLRSTQEIAFSVLWVSSLSLAGLSLFLPHDILALVLGVDASSRSADVVEVLSHLFGASLLISAATDYALTDAADKQRLKSATYQRLMLGRATQSAGYLLAVAQAAPLWGSSVPVPLLEVVAPFSLISCLVHCFVYTNTQTSPPSLPVILPKNASVAIYTAATILYAATAIACYAPDVFFHATDAWAPSASTDFLRHMAAPGFILASVAAGTLSDAADRGRLGAGTFKKLNLGLAAMESLYVVLFATAMIGGTADDDILGLVNIMRGVFLAVFCGYQGLYAKK